MTSTAAKALLNGWAEASPELKLPGKRLKLHEFLAQPINGSRKDAINQYWVTFTDMANHKLAVEQSQWLSSLSNPRQPSDQSVLKAAQQSAQNRVLHTEIQLAKSQSILSDYLPNLRYKNGKNMPVLPADIPWVGKLNTKLKEYQARGIVPARFNSIDEILPKARQLIVNRADAVTAATRAADQAKTAMGNGQSPISNVLEAARIKAKNQADFLSTVVGYNRAITDYVLSVRQDIYQPKRLASVLIGRKSVQATVAQNDKPQEDLDSSLNPSSPTLRQISTVPKARSSQQQNLRGQSAYQNGSDSSIGISSGLQQKQPSGFAVGNSGRSASNPKIDFGPTKQAAAATNFDPSKVREELPVAQSRSSNSSAYQGNSNPGRAAVRAGATAGANPGRTANLGNRGGRQPIGTQNRSNANGFGGNGIGTGQPGIRTGQPGIGAGQPGIRTGQPGIGAGQPGTNGSAAQQNPFGQARQGQGQSTGSRFNNPSGASATSGSGAEQPPVIRKSNPFNRVNPTAPDPTAGATTSSRAKSAFGGTGSLGGGTFGGSTTPPTGSAGTRFGNAAGLNGTTQR